MRKQQNKSWARGVTVVYASVAIIVMSGMGSLAVDFGRIQAARAEAQTVADVAARAAAAGLADGTSFVKAQEMAAGNLIDGQAETLPAQDVGIGTWNSTNHTFTPGGYNPNAVRVTVRRSGENGIPTVLSRVFGINKIDVAAQAIMRGGSGPRPIVRYDFSAGSGSTVADVSGVSPAMNLTIQHPGNVTWLAGGGLRINSATKLYTSMSTSRVRNAIAASNRCTIFVEFIPANTTQAGPARIFSYSTDTGQRNFTIGQTDTRIAGRLRTTATDSNGMSPELLSGAINNTTQRHRVALRYDGTKRELGVVRGTSFAYASTTTAGNLGGWNGSWRLLIGNEDTNDRAWRGTIYLAEIYDQALTDEQVEVLLTGGALSGNDGAAMVK